MEYFGITNFSAFLLAGIFLNITPGSDTLYILAHAISQGRKSGVLAALGISTGGLIHTFAAACGLSILLASSATLFTVVKIAGVCYLFYLGLRLLSAGEKNKNIDGRVRKSYSGGKVYASAVLTSVLNPKVALFFLAFLPQFVQQDYPHISLSFAILGGTFVCTGTLWALCLAVFASELEARIFGDQEYSSTMNKIAGLVMMGLAISMAFTRRSSP